MGVGEGLGQWIEISREALYSNIRFFRERLRPETRLTAVVKANAYGHGLQQLVEGISAAVDCFAVHSAAEARRVRRIAPERPVLLMGYLTQSELLQLEEGMELVISTRETLEDLSHHPLASSIPLHLKVDTGTHRQGIGIGDIGAVCELAREKGLRIVGLATHFANIEDTLEHDFAREQLHRFHRAIGELKNQGISPQWIHAACSAAALLFEETHFSMVRIGISLYGHWPSRETRLSWRMEHGEGGRELSPVLSWKTRVGQIQKVATGETVGYGRTWQASRPTRLAILPVGYSDGYPRALSNRGRVLVRGNFAPVVGRVCMNIMMVDVTDIPELHVGDEVVLIGASEGNLISVEELAEISGTINYELLSRLAPRIPRFGLTQK